MSKKNFFSLLMLLSINAFSQKDSLGEKTLDPLIVTAIKIEQKQSATGKVITIITKEQIEKSTGKSVAQVLNEQAGVTINGALNNLGSVQTLYMRGSSSGRVLILLDGIPVNDPSMINNEFNLNLISINDVERIEVCKGAQSTLYGSDAIGGVVNIITTKRDISKPINLNATAAFGNYGTFKGNVQLFGNSGKLQYITRYARLTSNGFSDAYDSTGNKNFANNSYNGDNISTAIKYQATDNLAFKSFIQYSEYKKDLDAAAFTDSKTYFTKNNGLFTGAGFVYKKKDFNLIGNYQHSTSYRYYDNNYTAGGSTYSKNTYNGASDYAELFASFKLSNNIIFLLGNDVRTSKMNSEYNSISSYGPYNNKFNDTSMSQYSVYASAIISTNDNRFHLEIGGRYNNLSKFGTNNTYTINPSYDFNENLKWIASIATGFKSPSIYQLYDTYSGNTSLKAEESTNYETGLHLKYQYSNVRAVYFIRNIDNGIDYNYNTYQYFNFVNQKVNGIEVEGVFHPTKALSISGNYTLIAGQETSQNRVTNKETITYDYLLRRPKNSLNINMGYQFNDKLYLSFTSKSVSDRYDLGGYKKADVILSGYSIYGVYCEYRFSNKVRLFFDGQNLLNSKFFDVYGYNSIPSLTTFGFCVKL